MGIKFGEEAVFVEDEEKELHPRRNITETLKIAGNLKFHELYC